MKPLTKAFAVALIQVLLVCSLGAKLMYDRRTRPQAWFKAERYDPNLPIRGRYLSLQIDVTDSRSAEEIERKFGGEIQANENQQARFRFPGRYEFGRECGSIVWRDGQAIAVFDESSTWSCNNLTFARWRTAQVNHQQGTASLGADTTLRLSEPILFFISDTAKDPSRLPAGDELWVLATIPRKGPPRPIALGVKKSGESVVRPLGLE
jgi:hypothetical protein